ncbi:MAG: hypothetical protein D6702_08270 [Planctomycetota bacterium]|nr:MAG: hypothetical protein D6702_08270 [Planctomycetota bacterium]
MQRFWKLCTAALTTAVLGASGAFAQGQAVVDGSGGTPGAYLTISDAVAGTAAGDTILAKGLIDGATGLPIGYANESFPIPATERTIKQYPGTPAVYVYPPSGSGATAVFSIAVSGGAPKATTLKDLRLVGGPIGVEVVVGSAPSQDSVTLDGLRFSRNETAVSVRADGNGEIGYGGSQLRLDDCTIAFDPLMAVSPQPDYRPPLHGLFFRAGSEGSQPTLGRIWAEIVNLKTVGDFDGLASSGETHLIHVEAAGNNKEHPTGQVDEPEKISSVTLVFQGGVLDGKAPYGTRGQDQKGWMVGVYAETWEGSDPGLQLSWRSYAAAVALHFSGTNLKFFRRQGVRVDLNGKTRGHVRLNGGTLIEGIGRSEIPYPPQAGDFIGTGVYLDGSDGLATLEGNDSEISRKWSYGVVLKSASLPNQPGTTLVPWGTHIDLSSCRLHQNNNPAIYLQAGDRGIAGGSWSFTEQTVASLSRKTLLQGREVVVGNGATFSVPTGMGSVDGCAISNTGDSFPGADRTAVWVDLEGSASGHDDCLAAVSFTNDIIWHNAGGGFFYDLSGPSQPGILLAPIVHCTVVGNGHATGSVHANVDLQDYDAAKTWFQWDEDDLQVSGNVLYLNTKFLNTVFQMKTPTLLDFGTGMYQSPPIFLADSGVADFNHLLLKGVRSADHYANNGGSDQWYTDHETPFCGPISWLSTEPEQFFLDPQGQYFSDFDWTPPVYGPQSEPAAVFQDFQPIPRPALVHPAFPLDSPRDKGAHQTPTILP